MSKYSSTNFFYTIYSIRYYKELEKQVMTTSSKPSRKSKKAKARKRKKRMLFTLEILVLFIMLGVLYVVLQSDKIEKDTAFNSGDNKIEINDELKQKKEEAGDEWHMSGYKNIALFGVDSREKNLGKGTRTDTIIIASLNEETGDIKLASIFRDTYLNIGNDTYNKANAAYAAGGPEQAIQMLNTNLDLDITDYATVDFTALINTIDALGGVPIDIQSDEIEHLNNYQICMAEQIGKGYTAVTNTGVQTLNGMQATAYCRIRYTAGDDFKRAERQRTVLMEVAKKAKTANVGTLNSIINEVFPKIKTSFSTAEMIAYAADATKYTVVDNTGFPTERVTGKMGKAGSSVVANDLAKNVTDLHSFLFGVTDYVPTSTVQTVSDKVASDKATYLGN